MHIPHGGKIKKSVCLVFFSCFYLFIICRACNSLYFKQLQADFLPF